jgi:hypothetical protein
MDPNKEEKNLKLNLDEPGIKLFFFLGEAFFKC